MKQKVRNLIKIALLLCFFLGISSAYAQEGVVTGKVTDGGDGSSLPGVSVLVKGTSTGSITDIDGNFKVKISQKSTLVISFIGYQKQEVEVEIGATLNIQLKVETRSLDEVVVIGYGTVKKSDATGSVTSVSSKDFNKGSITSPQDLLVGKSAGVVITSNSGAPGSGSTIRIRGGSSMSASNDPLIVIDGVPVDNGGISGMANSLSSINPNDIETFTVLKDASATAIYGSRASNGVIIITTKIGKKGSKTKFSYNGNVSVGKAPKFISVLNGDEYRALAYSKLGTINVNTAALGRLGTENTDWQSQVFQTSVSHDHNFSVSGATKEIPYRVSAGYTDQNGIVKNTNMKRFTGSANLAPTFLNNSLKVNVNAKGSYSKSNFGNDGAVGSSVVYDPTQAIRNGNTRYNGYTTWTTNGLPNGDYNQMASSNPVAQLELTTDNNSDVYRGLGNIQLDYKMPFMPELRANLNLGIDATSTKGRNNIDTVAVWTRRSGYGQRLDYTQNTSNKLIDFYLNYVKEFGIHKIDVTAGYSWQHFWRKGDNYSRSVQDLNNPSALKVITADSSNYETENFLVSFFGRVNYNINGRYLLTLTLRDDGSSRFAKNNRWGLFPSVAYAWNLKEEPFMANISSLDILKVRLGWGVTGQQSIMNNDYPYLGTYRIAQPTAYYQFGNKYIPTLRPNAYDPNIKWEETSTKNVGLDFGFFKERVSGSIDIYSRETIDMINNIAIPNGSNFSNFLTTNVGSMENKGVELSLNFKPITTKEMSWDIGTNFSYNENKITKLTRTDDPTYTGVPTGGISGGTGNNIQIQSVGYPMNSFYVLQQVYNENGMPVEGIYVNRSGENLNVAGNLHNFYRYKKPAADYTVGLTSRFNYKNFDAAFSGRFSIGNYVYNNIASQTFYGNLYNNNYWQNLSTQIDKSRFTQAQYQTDFYIENASFFKMDNMSIGYNFSNILSEKVKGRVSFVVQNVFTITKYSGLDPEVDGGIDRSIYPRARVFLLGLNFDF